MTPDSEMMINLARVFSPYPSGRTDDDGLHNGTRFRENVLVPAINKLGPGEQLVIDIDGVRAFGSSFLEEAFAGLVRNKVLSPRDASNLIDIRTTKPHLEFFKDAIVQLLRNARPD